MSATEQATEQAGPRPEVVEAGGTQLRVRRQGEGPPLLFLHGYQFTDRWLDVHERLSRWADVIAPDLPGFGQSPAPDHFDDLDDLRLVLRDLLDVLGVDSAHLLGWNFGGWVAADLAVHRPDRVASLTLLAPFGLRVPGAPVTDVFATAPGARQLLALNGETHGYEDLLVDPSTPEGFTTLYAEAAATGRYMWNPRYDVKLDHRLPRTDVPTLLVAGEHDRVVPRAHVERWQELLPDARTEIVAGGGHGLLVTHPQQVDELVREFLA